MKIRYGLVLTLAAAFVVSACAGGATSGGTGAAVDRGGFNTALNPANLSAASGWRIDGGLVMAQEHEDRFQPLWDSFGSFVVDTAIASNRNHYFDTGFAASKGFGDRFGGGVSLTTRYDFTYDFAEEVRHHVLKEHVVKTFNPGIRAVEVKRVDQLRPPTAGK